MKPTIDIRSRIRPEPADDRGTCGTCQRLDRDGVCTAAGPRGIVSDAQRGWQPSELWRTVPHRCQGFRAMPARNAA